MALKAPSIPAAAAAARIKSRTATAPGSACNSGRNNGFGNKSKSIVAGNCNSGRRNNGFGNKSKSVVAGTHIEIKSGLKEKQKREISNSSTSSSPLRISEDLASLLGFEMAVAGLERLFREASGGGADPSGASGPPGRPVRVAYQGVRGSYCQEAAALAFSASPFSCEAFPCYNMEEAFTALEDRTADRAVVPAENSIDGPIGRNLDLLLRHDDVKIVGELVLPVNHCLLVLPGVEGYSGLRRVISHPQALAHCEGRLRELGLEVEEVSSAADAARFVAENRIRDAAVIGSRIAAREFEMTVLEQNLQGSGGNYTRFLQLGLGGGGGAAARKTTVAFSLEKGVSDLFRAMWAFESSGVRVTRVDHRPNRSNPVRVVGGAAQLDYVFVLDVVGSESDSRVEAGLTQLMEIADFVRVLGSYTSTCGSRN